MNSQLTKDIRISHAWSKTRPLKNEYQCSAWHSKQYCMYAQNQLVRNKLDMEALTLCRSGRKMSKAYKLPDIMVAMAIVCSEPKWW